MNVGLFVCSGDCVRVPSVIYGGGMLQGIATAIMDSGDAGIRDTRIIAEDIHVYDNDCGGCLVLERASPWAG